jgi:Beta-fructosidases (levanase/invertase)
MASNFKFPSRYPNRPVLGGDPKKAAVESDFMRALCELRRENRKNDPYYPNYHFANSFGYLNDPNGPCYWNGQWHLFFQQVSDGTIVWGHAVSRDLIKWQELPFAIYPDTEGAAWSGAVAVAEDRAAALYYGHDGDCGLYCYTSSDPMLLNWEPIKKGPVISSVKRDGVPFGVIVPYTEFPEVYDPFIWHEDGVYYGLSGGSKRAENGGVRRGIHLFRSENLADWEYLHPFIDSDEYNEPGDDGACPYFIPFGKNGQRMLMYYSHMNGARYTIGRFDKNLLKFIPITGGQINTVSQTGGYMAPAAWPCGDGSGDAYALYIMHGVRGPELMSIPHRIHEAGGDVVEVTPACDYSPIKSGHVKAGDIAVADGGEVVLDGFSGVSAELDITIAYERGASPEVRVFRSPDGSEYTSVRLYLEGGAHLRTPDGWQYGDILAVDCSRSAAGILPAPPEVTDLRRGRNSSVRLRIFLDRSIIEVFSDGGKSIGRRVYPTLSSTGVSVTASGGNCRIVSAQMWQLGDVNTPDPGEYML